MNQQCFRRWLALGSHDDVIKWKHFPHYWPFVRGIHWSPVNSPQKGQWRGALMFPLICTRINGWVNNGDAGDLRRHRAHYDVTVMLGNISWSSTWAQFIIITFISCARRGVSNLHVLDCLFNSLFMLTKMIHQSSAMLRLWGNPTLTIGFPHKRSVLRIAFTSYYNTMHYGDVIMGTIASQITSLIIVCSTVYSGADQRKDQSSAPLAFVRGIHRGPVNSPHKGPVTRKMSPFNDVIMITEIL